MTLSARQERFTVADPLHEIMELLARLNDERGLTIIMVTHEPDMAAFAHRTIRFLDGRIESDIAREAA